MWATSGTRERSPADRVKHLTLHPATAASRPPRASCREAALPTAFSPSSEQDSYLQSPEADMARLDLWQLVVTQQ